MLRACKPAEHNYVRSKQLPNVRGLVNDERELAMPMRALDSNQLVGAQVIRWRMDEREWQKKMIYGTRAKGAVFRLGTPARPKPGWSNVTPPALRSKRRSVCCTTRRRW